MSLSKTIAGMVKRGFKIEFEPGNNETIIVYIRKKKCKAYFVVTQEEVEHSTIRLLPLLLDEAERKILSLEYEQRRNNS